MVDFCIQHRLAFVIKTIKLKTNRVFMILVPDLQQYFDFTQQKLQRWELEREDPETTRTTRQQSI